MSKNKVIQPNIVRGGIAIPMGNNYYYMRGRKHKNGGIDIGKNSRTGIEVEDGEVMHIANNEVKVFSAQPFLNGESPAKKVMGGENPNKVFREQERYKDRNGINDDGSKKKQAKGGIVINSGGMYSVTSNGKTNWYSLPSTGKRSKARFGITEDEDDLVVKKNKPINSFDYVSKPKSAVNSTDIEQKDNNDVLPKYTIKDYWNDNKENIILNGIGLTSNLIGGLSSYATTRSAINKMVAPVKPTAPINKRAAKLKTKININPQLSKMTETIARYERDVDNNTASSQVALARKQRARNNAILMANELYGDKENAETSLINKDRLNQQAVANANVDSYNAYLDKVNQYENAKAAFENDKIVKKNFNAINLINTVNSAVNNLTGNLIKSRSDNNTKTVMALANPNLPVDLFYELGLINKRSYDAHKKAYKRKKKNSNG